MNLVVCNPLDGFSTCTPNLAMLLAVIRSGGPGGNSSVNAGEADWFMASHATNHMTGDRTLISNLVPVSNQVVQAGDGEGMLVCGRGSVNTERVVLPDVWYVPGLTMNLVSVGQLTEDPDLSVSITQWVVACAASARPVMGLFLVEHL